MSSITRDVRHGRLIARVEFRRTVRAILANDSRLVSLLAFAVLSVPFGLF